MEHGAWESVQKQSQMEMTIKTEVEATATSSAHIDIEICLNHSKQEPGLAQSVKTEPALLVKEEILDDSGQDGNDQQCVQGASTPAGTASLNEACSTSQSDLLKVKNELDMVIDIGPTVLQHMDIHCTINKLTMSGVAEENTIVDDCNKAMPISGVMKESVEDKVGADKPIPCKCCGQKVTDDHIDKTHVRFCQEQKDHLHQHLPHLLSVHNKLNQQKSRKISTITKNVAASSNQRRDGIAKTKQNLDLRAEEYFWKPAKFSQTGDFTKQIKIYTGVKPYQCDTCDERFSQNSALILHKRVHTEEKLYRCLTCDARFSHKSTLMEHKRVHTGEQPYQCDTCDARFSHKSHIVQHMRVHTGEKPYQCDTCDARFAQKFNLIRHKRIHTSVTKSYRCDTCDARFTLKSYLVRHMRIHTDAKSYRCDTCDVKFALKSYLVQHMRIHTGEKPFRCDTCDARFSRSSALILHKRVHTGEKPYPCDTCDARFAQKFNLIRHNKRVHTGEKSYR